MTKTTQHFGKAMLTLVWFACYLCGINLSAQTDSTDPQTICIGSVENYQVDYTENGGAGTIGSTYAWAVTSGTFTGTLTPDQGPSGSSNRIEIDWGTSVAGTYVLQVIETTDGCPGTPIELTIELTPLITPTFAAIGPLCQGSTAPTLPTSSTNSTPITGTWDAAISTASPGTITYTFTPDAGQCADVATMDVTVDPLITPTFAAIGPLCQGSTAPTLPTSSTNSTPITGTWDAAISTASPGTITYTFTPTAGQCADVATMDVTVDPLITPTFAAIGPLCQGSAAPSLPTSSTNSPAITGAWDAAISTASPGTITYTFTPDAGQCADVATMDVTVDPLITPTFATIGPLCQGSTAPALPTNSTNSPAITGTWDAAISTASPGTITYTFTPTAGQCADVATMDVTVDPLITPTFAAIGPLCQGSAAPSLPTSSTNSPAITGAWDAAISTASPGTITYTFTPDAGQCADIATLDITVDPLITPTFAAIGPLCQGSTAPTLPTSSTNSPAITGTWDAAISTASANTTTYTFTPDAGQCADIATLDITVDPLITPTFAAIGPLCQGSTAPTLPTSSTNSTPITGTWDAAISTASANTTTYTFTPDAGQCAEIATLDVLVNGLPTVIASGDISICIGNTTTLTASGATTYTWLPITDLTPTTGSSVDATPSSTITYTVTGTDGNGCEGSDSVTVTVNPLPTTSPIFHN
jgi:large repetitive protein